MLNFLSVNPFLNFLSVNSLLNFSNSGSQGEMPEKILPGGGARAVEDGGGRDSRSSSAHAVNWAEEVGLDEDEERPT